MTVTPTRFILLTVSAVILIAAVYLFTVQPSLSIGPTSTSAYQPSGLSVVMNRYDVGRSGANIHETVLTTQNVNDGQFGKLFSLPVVGDIYAQPLVVSQLEIPGHGLRTVLYVATMHNNIYAFDADRPGDPFWSRNLGPIFDNTISTFDIPGKEVGILSTPVIDLNTETIYLVSQHDGNPPVHRLHALDLLTGEEKFGGPVALRSAVVGSGDGSKDGIVFLDSNHQLQRPGLLLLNGKLYIALGSTQDTRPFHGWLLAYDPTNLQETPSTWNATPDGEDGGIWMSGAGPSADADGNIYVITGNGTFSVQDGGADYGDSFVKLDTTQGMKVADYFAPYNEEVLDETDGDLGTTGPIFIPSTTLIVGGGKACTLYLLDTKNMGKFQAANNNQIVQNFCAYNGQLLESPVAWNSPVGPIVYIWGINDYVKAFKLNNGILDKVPFSTSWIAASGFPTGTISLSANGTTAGSAILWSVDTYGNFRALDAMDLTHELWSDKYNAARDGMETAAKFMPPMIANGKVYVPTRSGKLLVYGLLPQN